MVTKSFFIVFNKRKKIIKNLICKKNVMLYLPYFYHLLIYAKKEEIKCNNIIEQYKK